MIQGVMVHLLGSRSGYTTLGQSSALPGGVRSALEHLDFGSLSREQDIASLDASPMALGQCVAGSWMVMSRVLAGGRDDVGRLTIEKVSIIVPLKDWQSSVQDVRALVHDRGLWTRARAAALAGGTITVEAAPLRQSPLQATVAVVLDRWFKAVDAAGCVVVRADDEAVFKVLQSISPVDAARLSWGVGLHGVPTSVSLCSILPAVSASAGRPVIEIQPGERSLQSTFATALAACVKSGGVLPPLGALQSPVAPAPARPLFEPLFQEEEFRPAIVRPLPAAARYQQPSTDGRLGSRGWGIGALSVGAVCLALAIFWSPTQVEKLNTGSDAEKTPPPRDPKAASDPAPASGKPEESQPGPPVDKAPVGPKPPDNPPPPSAPASAQDERENPGATTTPNSPPSGAPADGASGGTSGGESGQTDSSSPSLKGKGDGGSSGDPGGSGAASTTNPPLDCNCSPPASLASQPPPDADRDRDLLKNTKEHSFGSDPDKADEDGDKLTDWFEWALGTDPRSSDSDGDGLCDCVEFTQSSSPIWRDTDRDGIDDADEKRLGLKAGTLHSTGGEPLKDWKKGVAPFVYSPVQGALVEGDSRDSDGDGVVDGSDIAPRDPKLGSLGSKEPKPIEEMRKLFQDFAKALKAPVGDNAVPKSDRAKFDELLKALANSPDIHKVLPTRVPGAYARRQAWLDALVEDPTVTARFYSEGLLEHVATVVRNVKNDKNKAGLTPFEQRVKDAWEACRSEAGAWKPCAAYQPDKEQASEPEPVPFQIESFRLTTYVDPGWVAVRMGIDSDDELRKATALVLLLEWCRGADDEKSVVIIEQGNRAEQHGLPNLRIFQQELDLLTKGPFPRGDPKAATGSTGASGEQK